MTVTLTSLCGNGTVDSGQGEQCDTAIAGSVCCNSTCHFTSGGACRRLRRHLRRRRELLGLVGDLSRQRLRRAARPSAAPLRAASVTPPRTAPDRPRPVPPDGFLSSATPCRPAPPASVTSPRTAPGRARPVRRTRSSRTPSRAVRRPASATSPRIAPVRAAACPPNGFESNSTICRGAAGVCDTRRDLHRLERSLPRRLKSTAVCRPAGGFCDVAETCDGVTEQLSGRCARAASRPCAARPTASATSPRPATAPASSVRRT